MKPKPSYLQTCFKFTLNVKLKLVKFFHANRFLIFVCKIFDFMPYRLSLQGLLKKIWAKKAT